MPPGAPSEQEAASAPPPPPPKLLRPATSLANLFRAASRSARPPPAPSAQSVKPRSPVPDQVVTPSAPPVVHPTASSEQHEAGAPPNAPPNGIPNSIALPQHQGSAYLHGPVPPPNIPLPPLPTTTAPRLERRVSRDTHRLTMSSTSSSQNEQMSRALAQISPAPPHSNTMAHCSVPEASMVESGSARSGSASASAWVVVDNRAYQSDSSAPAQLHRPLTRIISDPTSSATPDPSPLMEEDTPDTFTPDDPRRAIPKLRAPVAPKTKLDAPTTDPQPHPIQHGNWARRLRNKPSKWFKTIASLPTRSSGTKYSTSSSSTKQDKIQVSGPTPPHQEERLPDPQLRFPPRVRPTASSRASKVGSILSEVSLASWLRNPNSSHVPPSSDAQPQSSSRPVSEVPSTQWEAVMRACSSTDQQPVPTPDTTSTLPPYKPSHVLQHPIPSDSTGQLPRVNFQPLLSSPGGTANKQSGNAADTGRPTRLAPSRSHQALSGLARQQSFSALDEGESGVSVRNVRSAPTSDRLKEKYRGLRRIFSAESLRGTNSSSNAQQGDLPKLNVLPSARAPTALPQATTGVDQLADAGVSDPEKEKSATSSTAPEAESTKSLRTLHSQLVKQQSSVVSPLRSARSIKTSCRQVSLASSFGEAMGQSDLHPQGTKPRNVLFEVDPNASAIHRAKFPPARLKVKALTVDMAQGSAPPRSPSHRSAQLSAQHTIRHDLCEPWTTVGEQMKSFSAKGEQRTQPKLTQHRSHPNLRGPKPVCPPPDLPLPPLPSPTRRRLQSFAIRSTIPQTRHSASYDPASPSSATADPPLSM